jgi:hypothetical protein
MLEDPDLLPSVRAQPVDVLSEREEAVYARRESRAHERCLRGFINCNVIRVARSRSNVLLSCARHSASEDRDPASEDPTRLPANSGQHIVGNARGVATYHSAVPIVSVAEGYRFRASASIIRILLIM